MNLYNISYTLAGNQLKAFATQYLDQQAQAVEWLVSAQQVGNQFPDVIKLLDKIKNS